MCGNVGILNLESEYVKSQKLINFFKQALIVDSIRGLDGTGVAAINIDGSIEIEKSGKASQEFLLNTKVSSLLRKSNNIALCGHNRAATTGSLDDKGAHPFVNNHITLFHNGTLNSWSDLSTESFEIDSEAICAGISEKGAKKTLENINGAFALVWHNANDNTLNFARNNERPLYFGTLKKSKSFVYASEKGMIEWLATKNNIALDSVSSLGKGKWLSISTVEDNQPKISDFNIMKPIINYSSSSYYPDYSFYRSGGYSNSNSFFNESTKYLGIYDYLVGSILPLSIYSYEPFYKGSLTGSFQGEYVDYLGNTVEVKVTGKALNSHSDILGTTIYVKITGSSSPANPSYFLYGNFISKREEKELDILKITKDLDFLCINNPVEVVAGKKDKGSVSYLRSSSEKNSIALFEEKKRKEPLSKVSTRTSTSSYGNSLTKKTFKRLTKNGCSNCTGHLPYNKRSEVFWTYNNDPICFDCADQLGIEV